MKIIYTLHASSRIIIRFIRKEWVEEALRNPDKKLGAKNGRFQAVKKINGEKISVIYAKENDVFIVVTVYWGE